jgi:4,5-DOPA dioxygenase extradiol
MKSQTMPVIFLGHGSPMNAVAKNKFTQTLEAFGKTLSVPKAILMVSAHWMTQGTWVTGMAQPKTIHDFSGFPEDLYQIQYPAPGSPLLAQQISVETIDPQIGVDPDQWGLDHGAWSVLLHVFPQAQVPVVQLSLDMTKPAEFHFELGQKLKFLREQGVMVIGSGNVVHNLRKIQWEEDAPAVAWATEFDEWVKEKITARDFTALTQDARKSDAGLLSVPTTEHYLPLLYVLGAADSKDPIKFIFEGIQNASISMMSIQFG